MPHHSRVSIGQVLGHRQTGTTITAFLVLARDRLFHSICPLLFSLLACDLLRSHRRRPRRRLSCSVLSRPVPFRSGSIIYGTFDVAYRRAKSSLRFGRDLSPTRLQSLSRCLYFTLGLYCRIVRPSLVCCVAVTEGHARQLMIAAAVVVVVVATIDCGFGRCIDIHRTP